MIFFVLACSFFASTPPEPHHDDPDDHNDHEAEPAAHDPEVLQISDDLKRDLRVSTLTIATQGNTEQVLISGEVQAHENAMSSLSAPVEARVVRVLAATGDRVKKGDPLVELESVEVGQARAGLLAARATSEQARSALERKKQLSNVVSTAELELAEAESKVAQAALRAAEAELRALGVGLELPDPVGGRLVLRAPASGVIMERQVTLGAVVDREETLFRIVDLDNLEVVLHAFERDAVRLSVGDHADVEVFALPGRKFSAEVQRIGQEVEVDSRTIAVRVKVVAEGLLKPGMAATAMLTATAVATGVSAPGAALQRLEGGWVVFVPQGPDRFEIRPVGRGRDLGSEVEILSGLSAGETIVLEGAFLLKAEAEKRQGGGGHHDH